MDSILEKRLKNDIKQERDSVFDSFILILVIYQIYTEKDEDNAFEIL